MDVTPTAERSPTRRLLAPVFLLAAVVAVGLFGHLHASATDDPGARQSGTWSVTFADAGAVPAAPRSATPRIEADREPVASLGWAALLTIMAASVALRARRDAVSGPSTPSSRRPARRLGARAPPRHLGTA